MGCFFGHKWEKYGKPYARTMQLVDVWKARVVPSSVHVEHYQDRRCKKCGVVQHQKVATI